MKRKNHKSYARTHYKDEPTVLSEAKPGTIVFAPIGVYGEEHPTRARVCWHWKDGAVCVEALQLSANQQGERARCTFPGDTKTRRCHDWTGD